MGVDGEFVEPARHQASIHQLIGVVVKTIRPRTRLITALFFRHEIDIDSAATLSHPNRMGQGFSATRSGRSSGLFPPILPMPRVRNSQ